jgi:subtilisin family serine protease
VTLPGSTAGLYGFGTGTSFATPEVAGAAALVMAANPLLPATEAARILKATASNGGAWNPYTGYGQINVGAAVAQAQARTVVSLSGVRAGRLIRLRWGTAGASTYRVSVRPAGKQATVLLPHTTRTSGAFRLPRGPRYAFTVTAFDAAGTRLASGTTTVR